MKPHKKIITAGLLMAVLVIANSCTDDFKDLNTPANLITEDLVTPELLLTSVEYNAVLVGMDAGDVADYCGMNAQDDNLPFEDRFYDDTWNGVINIRNGFYPMPNTTIILKKMEFHCLPWKFVMNT